MPGKVSAYLNELCRARTCRTSAAPLLSMALLSIIVREFGASLTWPSRRTSRLIFEPVRRTSRFFAVVCFVLAFSLAVAAFVSLAGFVSSASATDDANARTRVAVSKVVFIRVGLSVLTENSPHAAVFQAFSVLNGKHDLFSNQSSQREGQRSQGGESQRCKYQCLPSVLVRANRIAEQISFRYRPKNSQFWNRRFDEWPGYQVRTPSPPQSCPPVEERRKRAVDACTLAREEADYR